MLCNALNDMEGSEVKTIYTPSVDPSLFFQQLLLRNNEPKNTEISGRNFSIVQANTLFET